MPKRVKLSFVEILINKTLLTVLCIVFIILAIVGATISFVIGAVFIFFFITCLGSLIGRDKIFSFFDDLSDKKWFK